MENCMEWKPDPLTPSSLRRAAEGRAPGPRGSPRVREETVVLGPLRQWGVPRVSNVSVCPGYAHFQHRKSHVPGNSPVPAGHPAGNTIPNNLQKEKNVHEAKGNIQAYAMKDISFVFNTK